MSSSTNVIREQDIHLVLRSDPMKVTFPVIAVRLRCKGCGICIEFDAVSRHAGQDIKEWVQIIQGVAADAHRFGAPQCKSQIVDLQIPVPNGTKNVGEVPKS